MDNVKLYNGDCLEVMKSFADKSIDCIICDLPYGSTSCKWDNIIDFDKLWEEYNRILKDNGNMEWLVKTYSNKNDVVMDNCMGSGTTGEACLNLNRKFVGIELDKTFYKICEKRLNI